MPDTVQSPFSKKEKFIIKNNNLYDNASSKPALLIKNVTLFDIFQNSIYWVSKDNALYQSDLSGKNPTQIFDSFYNPIKNIKISPDGQKVLYYNDYEIMYSWLGDKSFKKIFLNRFSDKIGDAFWLNNDYVIFTLVGKIKISESDNINEINIVELPQTADKIYFSQQNKKLYIQTRKETLVSEQLTQ